MTVQGPGVLELGINDFSNTFGDNSGSFQVVIRADDDRPRIRGTVRDVDGEGVARVRVSAGGKQDTTDASGGYEILLKKGTYTVAAAGYCVVGKPGCATSARVKLPPNQTVDFGPPPEHTVSGSVLERTCAGETCTQAGLAGVTVRATGGPGGPEQTTTAADGTYSLTLSDGAWKVEPSLDDRAFEHVDAQGEGTGEPFASVKLDADRAGVDFHACAAEDAEPGADDPPASSAKASGKGCKHLKVEIVRIKAAGDSGWTESSGKKLLGNARIPVGFTQPTRDGDFLWQCRTGCLNVRVKVRDAKTGRAVPGATVSMSVLAAPGTVTADAPNGVVCPALPYAEGCGERIERELGGKRDFDAYYWLPGVTERTNARIYVQVRAPGYVKAKRTQNVVVVPNAPIKHTLTFRPADETTLLYWGSLKKGLAFTDIGSYCDAILSGLNDLAGGVAPAGAISFIGTYAQKLVKQLEKGCGALNFGEIVDKLNFITPWKLYLWFLPRFGVPRNGLLGTSNIINRPTQLAFNFAGFFNAFDDGLVAYLYDRFDPTNPVRPSLQGNPLRLEIFEVSHRLASGKVKDALYLRFTGKQQGRPTAPYTAYAEGGYYPGCWLNPKLNEAEFSIIDLNPCKTDEP